MKKSDIAEDSQGQYNNRNRSYNSMRNISIGIISKLVAMVLTFISRTVFIYMLSVEYLGINALFVDVLAMLSLADLGIGTAMAFSFYKPLAERDEQKLAALTTFYRKVYFIIASVVAVIGLGLAPFLNLIVNTESEIPYLHIFYLMALTNTVISYLFVYKSSIISADQKGYIITTYSMVINIARTVSQIVVLLLTRSYLLYLVISIITTLANNLLISYKANKMYPFIHRREVLNKDERSEIFTNIKSVIIYKIAMVISGSTDNIVISILIGTTAVGLYSNYYSIIDGNLGAIVVIIFGSLTASVGNMIVKESPARRYEIHKMLQAVSFFISGVFIVSLYFLTDDFITLWIGREFVLDRVTLLAILSNFYLTITCRPIWAFREATGLYQKIKYVLFATAILNIALSILLGTYFGIAGVIAATTISRLLTYFWYEPRLLYKEFFQRNVWEYYSGHIINCSLIGLCVVSLKWIIPLMQGTTVVNWLINGVICLTVVLVCYGIRYYKTQEFQILKARLKSVITK